MHLICIRHFTMGFAMRSAFGGGSVLLRSMQETCSAGSPVLASSGRLGDGRTLFDPGLPFCFAHQAFTKIRSRLHGARASCGLPNYRYDYVPLSG